jgi:allantoate deiminase
VDNTEAKFTTNENNLKRDLAAGAAKLIEWLAVFGRDSHDGVTRLLYTQEWRAGQLAVATKMKEYGLYVYDDQVGNVFGRLEGTLPDNKTILTGSHLDTVNNGGKYDGAYGIIAGMIALDYLLQTYGSPKRSLEVVALCEEEGSRFPLTFWGSGNITGHHDIEQIKGMKDADGILFMEAMKESGYGDPSLKPTRRNDIAAFIELHIEQGILLERRGYRLGIVEAIVGQKRFTFTITGETGHAGTTPMTLRKDAMAGASEMILQLEKTALRVDKQLVATVGRITAEPNAANVIPGKVTFTVDARHTVENDLNQFCIGMISRFQEIAATRELHLDCHPWMDEKPVQLNDNLAGKLEQICQNHDISHHRMVSGAGHDSQIFQPHCPTVMLFVPSHRGISHSPLEFTSPESMADGILVLIDLLYQLGYEENFDENL